MNQWIRFRGAALFFAALVLPFAGCSAPRATQAAGIEAKDVEKGVEKGIEKGVEATAETTSVQAGEHFSTELRFSAGTGYAWTATGFDPGVVALVSQESRAATTERLAGGPMVEHFVFKGLATGSTTIRFELRRPWEKDVSPVETREVQVTVTSPEAR